MTHDAETEVALILRAASFAAGKRRTQKRKGADGLPYITHQLAVASGAGDGNSVGRVSREAAQAREAPMPGARRRMA